jgi:chromosome segregation ATPase
MARGGINKYNVQQARESVLAKGQNPSIDAIRIELGNTGSKSTIHRYLKEIEEEEGCQLDDEALLSNTLKEMVARLASRLHEEAATIVTDHEAKHKKHHNEWQEQQKSQSHALDEAFSKISGLETELSTLKEQHINAIDANHTLSAKEQRFEQAVKEYDVLIKEKDKLIDSLEEKHQHSRESLEHYRESVKDQREQDQRRHEQQVQQLQAEQRQLNQTLSIKQTDITILSKDNARLISEMTELRKQLSELEKKYKTSDEKLKIADGCVVAFETRIINQQEVHHGQEKNLASIKAQLTNTEKEKHELNIELAKLQAELEVKNKIFEKMGH